MCGIIGVINGSDKIKSKLGSVFDDMLWADQIRGTDGAGVMWFDTRSDTYSVLKDEDISAVRDAQSYKTALSWIEKMPFFIGHNRSATRGSVSSENNHPFDEGNVVLVHNGTMTHIPKEYDDGTQVDSHAIAKMLHKASPQEFMKQSFGAFALVWFDKLSRQLNILRNSQRPLHLVHFKDFILISSEAMLAAWCAARNGHGYEKIEEVKEHTLYQYSPYNITEPIITDLSALKSFPHENPTSRRRYHEYSQYPNGYCDDDECGGDLGGWWDGTGAFRATGWQKPKESNVILLPHNETQMEKDRRNFNSLNPWTYFDSLHRLPVNAPSKVNGSLSFKKGDYINFEIDGGNEHGTFTHFIGKIKDRSIKEYCVRGNVAMTLDEVVETEANWVGKISEIRSKHGLITLYVSDAEPVKEVKEGPVQEKQLAG